MSAPTRTTGGCQCGAIRYSFAGELMDPHVCHCRMCQKAAGNYFMPLGGVLYENFKVTRGEVAWFHSSDPIRRGFCRDCGTPLLFDPVPWKEGVAIVLGTLDDPAAAEPVNQYGTEARMPWLHRVHDLPGRTTEEDPEQDAIPLEFIAATNHQHPDHDTHVWPAPQSSA